MARGEGGGVPATQYAPGTRFNSWTVLSFTGCRYSSSGKSYGGFHLVRCDCGHEKELRTAMLKISTRCKNCADNALKTYIDSGQISSSYLVTLEQGARIRGVKSGLTMDDLSQVWEKQEGLCALSGLPLVLRKRKTDQGTASVDRIDSNKGYTVDNIQWVHKIVNKMKMDIDQNDFLMMCREISAYQERG